MGVGGKEVEDEGGWDKQGLVMKYGCSAMGWVVAYMHRKEGSVSYGRYVDAVVVCHGRGGALILIISISIFLIFAS